MSKLGNVPHRYARYAEIMFYEDASGWQTFKYGKLGELTENIRTFAPPFENQAYTFNMYFEYDSWNRIQIITYPDGEKVSYDYNRGGMLESVIGDKNGDTYKYIEEIRYNPFEQKESVHYGNGTVTDYSYDVLLRLSHLRSVCADGTMQDIDYDYDSVSNINFIENHAGALPSGLGGTYRSDYSYDNLYRLISANGEWHGNNDLYYETSMDYEANGRISRKVLYADTWLNGNYTTESYTNDYHYNSSQPNTLAYIDNSNYQDFAWDRKGNMVFHHNDHSGYDRRLCWDEQNRLQGVVDYGRQLSYYQYDAGGERTYKFTGEYTAQNQSGQWHYFYRLDKSTLYASPYIVSNEKGYTKHYYAESERIASRIGGGGLQELDKGTVNEPGLFDEHRERANALLERTAACLEASVLPVWDVLSYLYEWREIREEEKDCYWYHPDHLGSSSWITYTDGSAVQHLHYLPWGEDFVDQRSTSWNAMYTFSAKEKDTETGYSYFGSRYYNSDLSIWLSVDPLSDKYPSMSPYVYCANNPVKLVDPNGEELTDFYDIVTGEHIEHIEDGIDEAIAVHRSVYDAYVEEGTLEENKDKIGYSLGKNSDFVDLAGTIYVESDAWNYSLEESAGIGSVLRNRAIANNSSLVAEASSGNVFGWGDRESILSLNANPEKVHIAYRAAMLTIGGGCDFSKGGYYWQGRDFAEPGSKANSRFYQNGFHFRSLYHDIFGMGEKISNDSWKYKYESTAAAGRTVFMRLTKAWKNAHNTEKWYGGR